MARMAVELITKYRKDYAAVAMNLLVKRASNIQYLVWPNGLVRIDNALVIGIETGITF